MQLIRKTILFYLLISFPLLLIAGYFSYTLIRSELRDGADEALLEEQFYAKQLINSFDTPHVVYLSLDSLSYINPVNTKPLSDNYSNKLIYDKLEKEELNYRILTSYYQVNHQTYQIIVSKATIEEDELSEGLFSSFVIIIVFMLLSFFLVNFFLSKNLWKPFYKTLNTLNKYDVKNHVNTNFKVEKTKEFNQLNSALNKMTSKIYDDFLQQKEFIENASHEMQTPLAVVKANLSLLMQSPNLKEEEMNQLQSIENTIKKLASLNKSLLLLSKIENNQFNENTTINLKDKFLQLISNYNDVMQSKHIAVETQFDNDLFIEMNASLADVLLSNLLQNAIRHNKEEGKIVIVIQEKYLSIANTGEPLTISENDLFVRFKKNDASKDSLGLGLSIIKSITSLYKIHISYHYLKKMHTFTLKF